jgi:hypothetical protein
VDQATEDVDALDSSREGQRCHGRGGGGNRNLKVDAAVWPAAVVVLDIQADDTFEVPLVPDQRPVQALGSDGPHPALGERGRLRRPRRSLDRLHAGRCEHRIERGSELAVPVTDQKSEPINMVAEVNQEIPRRLRHPLAGRVRGDTGQMHPTGVGTFNGASKLTVGIGIFAGSSYLSGRASSSCLSSRSVNPREPWRISLSGFGPAGLCHDSLGVDG